MEAYVAPGDRRQRGRAAPGEKSYFHLVLLARDLVGYRNLVKLTSLGYTEGFYNRHPSGEYQNYERGISRGDYQQFVGEVTGLEEGWLRVSVGTPDEMAAFRKALMDVTIDANEEQA